MAKQPVKPHSAGDDPEEPEAQPEPEKLDNLSKALALARIGMKVFPVWESNRQPAIPIAEGGRGFYDGTLDSDLIATWFSFDYVGDKYAVAVWAGGSGVATADLDRKNGKDGPKALSAAGLAVSPTYSYPTKTGGEHHIYLTDDETLTLARDAEVGGKKLEGVDIRAGGSYFVWWGDEVPESRDVFSKDIPAWIIEGAAAKSSFTGDGFEGSIKEWLETIPDDPLPSHKINEVIARIPSTDFGHPEMVELAWEIVRLGAERETGVKRALDRLAKEWLRDPYNTPENRKDLFNAIQGGISKGGRVQRPVPSIGSASTSMQRAIDLGIGDELKALERSVSETDSEVDLARLRREMFTLIRNAGMSPSAALGIVTASKSFRQSKANVDSIWYADGEPIFHDAPENADEETKPTAEAAEKAAKEEETRKIKNLASDSEAFSFLDAAEEALIATKPYEWWGTEYLDWVSSRLKHFNRPYHVGAMWAALSVIASAWGKVPLQGYQPTDVNLYLNVLGDSSSGKSEAWGFGRQLIKAFYGPDESPIIGDAKKATALALHRTLILRDGKPSLVSSDEVQSFFEDIRQNKWQGTVLGDLSDYYGGEVAPKNTMNDKEISGKSARSLLTVYFTGIADMTLDAVNIGHWRSGLFYRYLWAFGHPRKTGNWKIELETKPASYTAEFEKWAREFKRVGALQAVRWGEGRIVGWEPDALDRLERFNEQLDITVRKSALYEQVFVPANGRFLVSVMKCATIIAMIEAEEKVTLRHLLIALSYAGPWHRSMVLAVSETGREAFDRDVERTLSWIRRNAIEQHGKAPFIQRSAVMREFKPNEVAERLLRQLTEEGWLVKHGDMYEITKEES